jgi:flavodoxin
MRNMKILIIYYTQTGRTKKVAEAIASSLKGHDIRFIRFEVMGSFSERFKRSGEIRNGNFSRIQNELNSLEGISFDLLIIGMPTHGGPPPKVYEEIVDLLGDLNGKKAIVFNTARLTGSNTPNIMAAKLEEAGAEVIEKQRFKGFFRLRAYDAIEFGNKINQMF